MSKEKETLSVQQELQMYSKEALAAMSNEEHARLGLKFFIGDATEGKINLAHSYFNKRLGKEQTSRGCPNIPAFLGLHPVSTPVDDLLRKLKPKENNYAAVNRYTADATGTAAKYLSHINELYVDLDVLHDLEADIEEAKKTGDVHGFKELLSKRELREEYLKELLQCLEVAFAKKALPVPSLLMCSGRGYALHFHYAKPLPATEENIGLHIALYNKVFDAFRSYFLSEGSVWHDRDLDVDARVRDIARIARIPGTWNKKANKFARIISFGDWYEFEELAESVGTSTVELLESQTMPEKETKKKANREETKENRKSTENDLNQFRPQASVKPYGSHKYQSYACFIVQCLDEVFTLRKWVEGAHRERFLFIFFNFYQVLVGREKAYEALDLYRQEMQEQLSMQEFNYAVEHIKEFQGYYTKGFLQFSIDTIVSPNWLDLTEEEADKCGFFRGRKQKEQYAFNNALSAERDVLIASYFLRDGCSYHEIAERLPKHLKVCEKTVKRTLKRLKVFGEENKGKAELFDTIDFVQLRRYQMREASEEDGINQKNAANRDNSRYTKNLKKNFLIFKRGAQPSETIGSPP